MLQCVSNLYQPAVWAVTIRLHSHSVIFTLRRTLILSPFSSGSGKTLAFAIPMIHSILEWRKAQERGPSGEQEAAAEEAEDVEEDEAEDGCEEEEDSTVGCVKVVRDVDVNFNSSPPENAAAKRPLLGLVVTPTRELAVQVRHHIDAVARLTGEISKLLYSIRCSVRKDCFGLHSPKTLRVRSDVADPQLRI